MFLRIMRRAIAVLGFSSALLYSATLPGGFAETLVSGGLTNPTAMALAPDGRIFVCEQEGRLRVIKNGLLLSAPFVTLTVNSTGERGLLGVTFDPGFAGNQFVYVYYTATSPTVHNRVSRFTASGDAAAQGSEAIILELDDLSAATNHNGGAIHFGPDGKLYVSVGENANGANAQTLSNLLGKMLRIDPNGNIPLDNPFFSTATGRNRAIWALGLRNPFTFAFQPGIGRMFINDVGQNTFEEINEGIAGANYGWPLTEGPTTDPRFRTPLLVYGHVGDTATTGCAIVGGAFYNPATMQFPAGYLGSYFFADLCSGWIRRFDPATGSAAAFASGISNPVDLAVSNDGSLYYLARGNGSLFRVRSTGSAPSISVFRNGLWFRDLNANRVWDGATGGDQFAVFGINGDRPIVGRWATGGSLGIGVFRNGLWFLDANGNGVWDGTAGGDKFCVFGSAGDIPIVGDWTGTGQDRIGVFRNALWFLDANGNGVWDGPAGGDQFFAFGTAGDIPLIGDWTGTGQIKIGVFRNGFWFLDTNGNRVWDSQAGGDQFFVFGSAGDIPVVGDWTGTGQARIGVFRNGLWFLDANGNKLWEGPAGGDQFFAFGIAGDAPTTGGN